MREEGENLGSGPPPATPAAPDLAPLVFENISEGVIVTDDRGGFRVFNREATRLLGAPPRDAAPEDWPARFGARVHDGETPCSADTFPLLRAMRGETVGETELAIARGERGEPAWIRGSAHPLRDDAGRVHGAVMVFREITTRKHADESLLAERARLAQQYRRQAALAALELSITEVTELRTLLDRLGEFTEQLLPSDGACVSVCDPSVASLLEAHQAAARGSIHAIEQLHRHHGAFQWIIDHRRPLAVADIRDEPFPQSEVLAAAGVQAYAGVPLIDSGQVLGVLFATSDSPRHFQQEDLDFMAALANRAAAAVTKVRLYEELAQHREHLEQLVRERTAELEESHQRLRLADRLASIGTLTAGLGHDMNNVLFPVRCRLDALGRDGLPGDARRLVETVSHAVGYLQQLTDGLRLFALDPDDAEASSETTDVAAWWRQVRPLLEQSIHGVRLQAEVGEGLPAARVAPHRLTQAVLNLVVNAGEASRAGGVVRLKAERGADDDWLRLAVSDDGLGMSPNVREQAFDPFFTTKRRGRSTGLGLSLVHGVVATSGGRIEIESAEGQGTTVRMMFPTGTPPAAPAATGLGPADVALEDPLSAAWVARLLREAGFDTRASSRPQADAALWVTEARESHLETARAFLAGRSGRRVLVVGPAPNGWDELGAIVIEESRQLDALRAGIGAAIAQLGADP